MRNSKGRMKYYKFYAYYIVEKLIVSRASVVSTLTHISTNKVLYALSDFTLGCNVEIYVRKTHKSQEAQNETVSRDLL